MLIFETQDVLVFVIQDLSEGETHLDLAGDFDGYSLLRVNVDGSVEVKEEIKTSEAVREFFGVAE